MQKTENSRFFGTHNGMLFWTREGERLEISGAGTNALRVRGTLNGSFREDPVGAVQPPCGTSGCQVSISGNGAAIRNGAIEARVTEYGRVCFFDLATGVPVLEESDWFPANRTIYPKSRQYLPLTGDSYRTELRFAATRDEHFYGMGQHRNGVLDQRGTVIDLVQKNGEVCIPFYVSSKRYGFIWNTPAIGRVEFSVSQIRWVAEAAHQIDYIVIGGRDYRSIMRSYVDITGHAPMLPYWASGFWQSKLRYESQEEVLSVAREYKRRGLPLAAIVIDFMHWEKMGDWDWDRSRWPDPGAMVGELEKMGVVPIVSVWPTVNPRSASAQEMIDRGFLVGTKRGQNLLMPFFDAYEPPPVFLYYYDATNPDARRYVLEKIRDHYFSAGVKNFWLDACEPEIDPPHTENLVFHLGDGAEVAGAFPFLHQKGFHDFLAAEGSSDSVLLSRSAWLGSQRYGSALWSGDIESSWATLRAQIGSGLNTMMSGIPWWTSDIGGFFNGNINDPDFRELVVRWFQFGVFCPLFRLHGNREPRGADIRASGRDNEAWSFGEEAYAVIRDVMLLRERLRPYIMAQMKEAAETGTPPMRPLFFDYPDDGACYNVEDEFLLGPDILVAPVYAPGMREREVYLPAGAVWHDAWTGKPVPSGSLVLADAPLARIPVYTRGGAKLPFLP